VRRRSQRAQRPTNHLRKALTSKPRASIRQASWTTAAQDDDTRRSQKRQPVHLYLTSADTYECRASWPARKIYPAMISDSATSSILAPGMAIVDIPCGANTYHRAVKTPWPAASLAQKNVSVNSWQARCRTADTLTPAERTDRHRRGGEAPGPRDRNGLSRVNPNRRAK